MTALRFAFFGTAEFAVPSLAALAAAGHDLAAVYCQPPRPAGRGHKERPSAVQAYAVAHGYPVEAPKTWKDADVQAAFAALDLDVAVVAAYGLLLPPAVLTAPTYGCVNVHASLLPRWRGAAPIVRAILAGDAETGVTIMQMDEGLDTGDMLLKRALPIGPETTAGALHDDLAELGAALVVEALAGLAAGTLSPMPQDEKAATYAAKISPDDARLDWAAPAAALERQVRAFAPQPGAWFDHRGERIKVRAAALADTAANAPPGTVLDDGLTVACGAGALRPTELQRPGKAAMAAEAFLRGFKIEKGTRLG